MCPIPFNIYRLELNKGSFSSRTAITHFLDKPYQKINFKSYLTSVILGKQKKYCQICTCPMWFYFIVLICTHFCNKTEKCKSQKSLKYFSILLPMKNDVKFEYVPWKYVWFCFIYMVWVHFSHKIEKFWL